MRLRIDMTETDIATSKTHPWLDVMFRRCPIYREPVLRALHPTPSLPERDAATLAIR